MAKKMAFADTPLGKAIAAKKAKGAKKPMVKKKTVVVKKK